MHREITVKELNWDNQEEWDRFVDASYNGSVFHKMKFLSYHPKGRFDYTFLGFYTKKGALAAVLPCVVKEGVLRSPAGASFGGIVLKQISFITVYNVVQNFLSWSSKKGIRQIYFTHAPLIYNDKFAQDLDFVLHYCGFENRCNLFSSILDLFWFAEDDPIKNLSSPGQRAIRKSYKEDVKIVETDDLEEFYPILVKNKAKFGIKPAHSLEELNKLRALFPGYFKLFAAYYKEKMVTGVFSFHCNQRVLLTFYIASLPEYQHIRPVNRALYDVAVWACKNGYKYLDLGVSMNTESNNPMEPAWSLISFKEFIGSRGFLRPYYEWINPGYIE